MEGVLRARAQGRICRKTQTKSGSDQLVLLSCFISELAHLAAKGFTHGGICSYAVCA